jgi:hypothetical protein
VSVSMLQPHRGSFDEDFLHSIIHFLGAAVPTEPL